MAQNPPFDDPALGDAAQRGLLHEFLRESVRREHWFARGPDGTTLLHVAACGDNRDAAALLLLHGLDVNARTIRREQTPVHHAAGALQPRVLEVLCADPRADVHAVDKRGSSPLDHAMSMAMSMPEVHPATFVLLANGVRLHTATDARLISPEMEAFERGVLRCRSVVVALLGIKKHRGLAWQHVDRFVVREMALACWSTRTDRAWCAWFVASAEYAHNVEAWQEFCELQWE